MEEDLLEEEREKYLVDVSIRVLWIVLVVLTISGILASLTVVLDWWRYVLLCLLGVLVGVSITVGILTSARSRDLIILVLGVFVLTASAAYLSSVVVKDRSTFDIYSTSLLPFFAYAISVVFCSLSIRYIWLKKPAAPEKRTERVEQQEERKEEPVAIEQEAPVEAVSEEVEELPSSETVVETTAEVKVDEGTEA